MSKHADAEEDSSSRVNEDAGTQPQIRWRVAAVKPLPNQCIHVRFIDGLEGVVDLAGLISSPQAGVFRALRDPAKFAQVFVDGFGAVAWPGELDLAPDAMYTEIASRGTWVVRR